MAERPFARNGRNGRYGPTINDHEYGQTGCLLKEYEKCRSPVKELN